MEFRNWPSGLNEHTAGCLLYRDGAKYYVEITIRNQSGHDLTIGDGLIGIEQDGRELERIDTDVAVAQLDTNTRKTFVLVAFGDRTPSYRHLRTHEKTRTSYCAGPGRQ